MTARELYAIAVDGKRPKAERLAARDELIAAAKKAKKGVAKLINLMPEGVARWEEALALQPDADPLDEAPMAPSDKPKADDCPGKAAEKPKKAAPKKKAEDDERGKISAEVRRLLTTSDMPYAEIEAAVRKLFPKARTTTRSIASVASDLRGRGEKVATRRVAAKAK